GDELRLGDETRDRAEVDDRPASGPADLGNHVLGDQRHADDVHVENPLPFLDSGVDPPQDEDGGIVDEDVDSAKAFHGLGDHPHDARLVGDVGLDEEGPAAAGDDSVGDGPSFFDVDIGNDYGGPFAAEDFAGRFADAVSATRDDGDFLV